MEQENIAEGLAQLTDDRIGAFPGVGGLKLAALAFWKDIGKLSRCAG